MAYYPEHESMELATIALIFNTTVKLTSVIENLFECVEKLEEQGNQRLQQSGLKYCAKKRVSQPSRPQTVSRSGWNSAYDALGYFARDYHQSPEEGPSSKSI